MVDGKYTIVVALKEITHKNGTPYNNVDRFLRIGMKTYTKYLNTDDLYEFIVIVPKNELATIKAKLNSQYPTFPWKLITEDVLVSKKVPTGWAKQQVAKLAVALIVATEHYLIVDDDTYLTKPFGYADMFRNGKLIMNKCQIDFPFFFLWSAQTLGVDFDEVQSAPFHMAITPEIFVTDVVKDIVKLFETKYGTHMVWQERLAELKFTEYCVYWTYLRDKALHDTMYYCDEDGYSLYGYPTSGQEHDLKEQVRKSFQENDGHFFSFVQSSRPYTVCEVEQEVLSYL
jgi:hypothetical protein